MRPRIHDYDWKDDLEDYHAQAHPPAWLGVLVCVLMFLIGGLGWACVERMVS